MTSGPRIFVRGGPSLRAALPGEDFVDGDGAAGFAVATTPAEVAASAGPVWLRPIECGGAVSPFTALILIRAAVASGRPFVCEGLGVRAAAAAVAVGAAGVVVDTPLWATREGGRSPEEVAVLRAADTASSRVEGELADVRRRWLVRGPHRLAGPQTVRDAAAGEGLPAREVLDRWVAELRRRVDAARSPGPRTIACGPMANVTEGAGFARALTAVGVTPFLAMGALAPDRVAALLAEWGELGGRFGVGLIGFDVMPHRDAHVAAVRAASPRPTVVTVAGGTTALALGLQRDGFEVWLHTPSAGTLAAALDAGVRGVVLEGHEAGGHVGAATSAGSWEDGLALLEARPTAARLVLAGGLGDDVSAAFAAAMAAPFVAAGGDLVLQAGTAFLLTHEAVETGAVTGAYQAEALRATETVLVGSSVNLPLRCTPNRWTERARSGEAESVASVRPLAERRAALEHDNLGRTRMAAKGIERDPTGGQRYRVVPPGRQRDEAAFTIGQGATVTTHLGTVASVASALGPDATRRLAAAAAPRSAFPRVSRVGGTPSARISTTTADDEGHVAIVGMGCVLPLGLNTGAFWRGLVEGRSAVGLVPPERWPLHRYHDPDSRQGTRSYARHAAVVDGFVFDPLAFRIPPRVAATMDPSQRMALVAAAQAVAQAGWDRGVDRARAAVVLGNAMGGEFSKSMAVRVRFREVLDAVAQDELALGWTVPELAALEARVEERLAPRLPPVEVDSMAGLLSNVVAGRVAAWLDWNGGNLTVDAACAASLASVAVAVDWLRAGRCDAVLAGGVDTDLSPESYVGFCRTEALSRTGSRPFSAGADGFVMGEGAAVLALMRVSDARRQGRPVLAVIRGVGQSSDGRGRGITAPRAEGQDLAIDRAWREAGVSAEDFGLLEAHGTGTSLGDDTEVAVLTRRFAHARTPTWLGSVKSMIGHLKGGAGAASLVKATLALASGVVPPTLAAGPVHPDLPLTDGPLRLPSVAVPLPRGVAGVSAFGFGGTNFHVVLARGDAADPHPEVASMARVGSGPALDRAWRRDDVVPVVVAWGAPTDAALRAAVDAEPLGHAPEDVAASAVRVVVLANPGANARPAALRALDGAERGAYLGRGPAAPVHVMFPGQGAQAKADEAAVRRLPAAAAALAPLVERAERELGRPWDTLLADARDGDVAAVHAVGFGLATATAAALADAGVPITSVGGHSLGAFAAAVAAGAYTADAAWDLVAARARALASCPEGAMVAVFGEPGDVPDGVALAARNGDGQDVYGGPPDVVDTWARRLGPARAKRLAVTRAYHGPLVAPAAAAMARAASTTPPAATHLLWWSARTGRTAAVTATELAQQVTDVVRFDLVWDGVRAMGGVVVDAGPGETMASLARRCGLPSAALHGARGPAEVAALLLSAGHPQLLAALPGTACERALPTPRPPAMARRAESRAASRATDAERLVDLQIASLADPALVSAYVEARRRFVRQLHGVDAPDIEPAAVVAAAPGVLAAPVVAAPPVATSVVAAPAVVAPPPGDVRAAVVATIERITGYPPDWIRDGADLEADLGVDSIRKMEILGSLETEFGFRTPEAEYGALERADLGSLVAHVERHRADRDGADRDGASSPTPTTATAAPAAATVWLAVPVRMVRSTPGTGDVHKAVSALQASFLANEVPTDSASSGDAVGAAMAAWLRAHARETGRGDVAESPSLALDVETRRPLPDGLVVLATGGLRGILAPCLRALADRRPRVVVLHRPGSVVDGDVLPFPVVGVPGDASVAADVARAASVARSTFGRIDLVVHAAGALRDGPWDQATDADRRAVIGPKWDGARHLAAATADDALHGFVTFSSLVAHVGNARQTVYAAANAAMETVEHPRAPTLHLAWTAWGGVGMAAGEQVARVLAARGVHALDPEVGGRTFRALVESGVTGPVLVGAQPLPGTVPSPWPLGAVVARDVSATTFRLPLDPAEPWLADHRVGDRPLVPAACWVQAMLGGAASAWGGRWAAEELEVLVPTFVDRPRADVSLTVARVAGGVRAEVRAGGAVVARAGLAEARVVGGERTPTAARGPADEDARALYRPDLLFHGACWQVLDRWGARDDHFVAELGTRLGPSSVAGTIDGIHQVLAAVGDRHHGWVGLPVGAARWEVSDGVAVRLEGVVKAVGRELFADAVALDVDGRVVVRGSGVRLRAARTTGVADA